MLLCCWSYYNVRVAFPVVASVVWWGWSSLVKWSEHFFLSFFLSQIDDFLISENIWKFFFLRILYTNVYPRCFIWLAVNPSGYEALSFFCYFDYISRAFHRGDVKLLIQYLCTWYRFVCCTVMSVVMETHRQECLLNDNNTS